MPTCESTAHHHVDVAASVAAASRRSARFALVTLALAVVLVATAAAVEPTGWPDALRAGAGWIVAALAAAALFATAGGGRDGAADARRVSAGPALVGSAVVAALLTVATAWWVAVTGGHPLWAMAGWALAAALFQLAQSRAWRRTLRQPGDAGEVARDQAVHGEADRRWPFRLGWWAVPAVAFGLWTWALGTLAVTVLVVVPAAVLLQLALARRALAGVR